MAVNTKKIVKVLKKEGKLSKYKLCVRGGGHCAVGALLYHAGIPNKELRDFEVVTEHCAKILNEEYGLSSCNVAKIMVFNDDYKSNNTKRCKAVIRFIQKNFSDPA